MDDANDNDPLLLPLRFPFVDPANVGPDNVPFKVPRDFGFRQPFRLFGRRFTEDLDQRNREEKFMFVHPTSYSKYQIKRTGELSVRGGPERPGSCTRTGQIKRTGGSWRARML